MKTISIRLEDSIYEELGDMLDAMGQTKQTFYETFTRTALRERCIPFIVKAPMPSKSKEKKIAAFERLEAARTKNADLIDFEQERGDAIDEKYGHID